jgi:peroxiredoxin
LLNAGSRAPSFALDDMSGARRTLDDILTRGPVLLAVYKISCPVCQLAAPYIERISKGSLQVIGVSQDSEIGTLRFQSTYGLSVPALLDREEDGYSLSNALGVTHVPSLFLVEPDGTISRTAEGFSKLDLTAFGERAGVETFRQGDNVPEWKAG